MRSTIPNPSTYPKFVLATEVGPSDTLRNDEIMVKVHSFSSRLELLEESYKTFYPEATIAATLDDSQIEHLLSEQERKAEYVIPPYDPKVSVGLITAIRRSQIWVGWPKTIGKNQNKAGAGKVVIDSAALLQLIEWPACR